MFSLTKLHTFGLHASATAFSQFRSIEDVSAHLESIQQQRFLLLGEGSNCIFIDDFDGMIVRYNAKGIAVKDEAQGYKVSVKAGENWHDLVAFCIRKGIFGFENLALIPGTVGAAPIQNIGAYGVEIEKFIERVDCINLSDGRAFSLTHQECRFGYRDSVFKRDLKHNVLIDTVVFYLPKHWQPVLHYGELSKLKRPAAQQIFDKVVQVRRQKLPDPAKIGNAGSFFKNPLVSRKHLASLRCDWIDMPFYEVDHSSVKVPAAWLIDKLGFKGRKVGGIGCHPSQALVLTNDGTGTAEQLLTLAREIQQRINQEFSISLENEVRLIGKHGAVVL